MKLKSTLLILLIIISGRSFCNSNHVITFTSNSYSPSSVNVAVGDTVTWVGSFTSHPLSSTSVPSGASTFHNSTGSSYSYIVQVAGTYNYQCDVHHSFGMTGSFVATVVAGVEAAADNNSLPLQVSYYGGLVRIKADNDIDHGNYDIRIGNILGENVWRGKMSSDEEEKFVEIQDQPKGVYVVALVDDHRQTYIRKFSIQ